MPATLAQQLEFTLSDILSPMMQRLVEGDTTINLPRFSTGLPDTSGVASILNRALKDWVARDGRDGVDSVLLMQLRMGGVDMAKAWLVVEFDVATYTASVRLDDRTMHGLSILGQ